MHGNTFMLPIHFNMVRVVHDIYLVTDEPERNAVSMAVFTQLGMIIGRDLGGDGGLGYKVSDGQWLQQRTFEVFKGFES